VETVEAQFWDVQGDVKCHTDRDGNTYDFAFGLGWSVVIKDGAVLNFLFYLYDSVEMSNQ